MILSLRARYLFSKGGLATISETNGSAVLSKFKTTYLNFMSSLVILAIENAASICANHRIGFSFQNGGSFARVVAPITDGGEEPPPLASWSLDMFGEDLRTGCVDSAFGVSSFVGECSIGIIISQRLESYRAVAEYRVDRSRSRKSA